jgi:hypothetical protein
LKLTVQKLYVALPVSNDLRLSEADSFFRYSTGCLLCEAFQMKLILITLPKPSFLFSGQRMDSAESNYSYESKQVLQACSERLLTNDARQMVFGRYTCRICNAA